MYGFSYVRYTKRNGNHESPFPLSRTHSLGVFSSLLIRSILLKCICIVRAYTSVCWWACSFAVLVSFGWYHLCTVHVYIAWSYAIFRLRLRFEKQGWSSKRYRKRLLYFFFFHSFPFVVIERDMPWTQRVFVRERVRVIIIKPFCRGNTSRTLGPGVRKGRAQESECISKWNLFHKCTYIISTSNAIYNECVVYLNANATTAIVYLGVTMTTERRARLNYAKANAKLKGTKRKKKFLAQHFLFLSLPFFLRCFSFK